MNHKHRFYKFSFRFFNSQSAHFFKQHWFVMKRVIPEISVKYQPWFMGEYTLYFWTIWTRFRFLGNPMELELATASQRIWSTVSLLYQNFPIEFEIVQRRPCPGRYQSRLLIIARRKIVWFNLMIRYQLSEPRLSTINQDMFFDRSSTESKFFRIFFYFQAR